MVPGPDSHTAGEKKLKYLKLWRYVQDYQLSAKLSMCMYYKMLSAAKCFFINHVK